MAKKKKLATGVYIDGKFRAAGESVTAAEAKELREGGWSDDRADLWEDGDDDGDDDSDRPGASSVPADHPDAPPAPDVKVKK